MDYPSLQLSLDCAEEKMQLSGKTSQTGEPIGMLWKGEALPIS